MPDFREPSSTEAMRRTPFAIEAEAPTSPRRMLAVAVALAVSAASVGWIGSSVAESLGAAGDRPTVASQDAPVVVARLGS